MDIKLQNILNEIVSDVLQEESGGTSSIANDIVSNNMAKPGGIYDQYAASQQNIDSLQDTLYDMGQNPHKYSPEDVAAAKAAYQKALDPHYRLQDAVDRYQSGDYTAGDVVKGIPSYLAHKARVITQDNPGYWGLGTGAALGTALAAGAGALALRKKRRAAEAAR